MSVWSPQTLSDCSRAHVCTAKTAIQIAGDHQVTGGGERLVLHPETLALGVGCERDTDPAELCDLVTRTLADAGLAAASIATGD